jgi:hypothetical protein
VHKHADQLPADEQLGGEDALILDGEWTYKVFAASGAFSVDLAYVYTVTETGNLSIAVPVQVHAHGDPSTGAAVWRLSIDGATTAWQSFKNGFEDKTWLELEVANLPVAAGDKVNIILQMESRALGGIDFFTDAWEITETPEEETDNDDDDIPVTDGYAAFAVVVDYDIVTDVARRQELFLDACARGVMVGPSHDHVARWPKGAGSYTIELPDIPVSRREDFIAWYKIKSPYATIVFPGGGSDDDTGGENTLAPGLHFDSGSNGAEVWFAKFKTEHPNVRPPSVKAYGTVDTVRKTLALFKTLFPGKGLDRNDPTGILTVARIDGIAVNVSANVKTEATRVMNILIPKWEQCRSVVDVFEIGNEEDPVGTAGHTWLAEFYKECMTIAEKNGFIVACFSYSTGVPEWDEMQVVVKTGVFERIRNGGHFFALHEYARPINQWYGEALEPVAEGVDPSDKGPLMFRYRYWKAALGWLPNTILTEANINGGLATISPADWEEQMRWWLDELQHDPEVWGVHVFTWGKLFWEDFDISHMADTWYKLVVDYSAIVAAPDYYSQRDTRWAGMHLGTTAYIMDTSGCAVTSVAEDFRLHGIDIDPGTLCAWLNTNNGFTSAGALIWAKPAEMFAGKVKFIAYHTWRDAGQVADMDMVRRVIAEQGAAIIQVDFVPATSALNSHFVLAVGEKDNDILIIDPWTGTKRLLLEAYGINDTLEKSIKALAEYQFIDDNETKPLVGFNDPENVGAGNWMRSRGLAGLLVVPIAIGTQAATLDFHAYADAGIRVIVNICKGWSTDCGGSGTIPVPGTTEWTPFIQAATQTINNAQGVYGFVIGNEMNNPRESPVGATLNAAIYVQCYNAIRAGVEYGARMAPGALDPFNAQLGDPRDWLRTIFQGISGAEFVTAHGYTRGPDPTLVDSLEMFADAPLNKWQYLNFVRCVIALLEALPERYQAFPVYVTEFNHLWKTSEAVGDVGWVTDSRATNMVYAAYAEALDAQFSGLAIYRWSGDAWAVSNNGAVLSAVVDLL